MATRVDVNIIGLVQPADVNVARPAILGTTTMGAVAVATGARVSPAAILGSTTLPSPSKSTGVNISRPAILGATTMPAPASVGSGGITHGDQITSSNTGYGAYFDSGLGRLITSSDLTVRSGNHWISDYVSAGGTLRKQWFTGFVNMDINNVTMEGCLFDGGIQNFKGGVHATGTVFNYCSFIPASSPGAEGIAFQGYTAYRCQMANSADGAKINGAGTYITECYIRVAGQDALDHNDGLQNVGGDGQTIILRSNISCVPANGVGGPDAAILSADFGGTPIVDFRVVDCLLNGGTAAFTLRLYDGALSTNLLYIATGNKFVRGVTPLHRGTSNTTPTGQITWSGNTYSDDGEVIPLV